MRKGARTMEECGGQKGEVMGRRERKKLQSRRAIIEAAVTEFKEKGFREASVADIMTRADLGLGTFYNYFQSKEDILMSLLSSFIHDVEEDMQALRREGKPATELIASITAISARFLDKNRFLLPLFLAASDQSGMPEEKRDKHIKSPRFKRIFADILREGQDKGEIRTDVPVLIIAEMFHSLYQAAAFSELDIPFEENVAFKTRLLLDGIKVQR